MKTQTRAVFDPSGIFSKLILPKRFREVQSKTRFKQVWVLNLFEYLYLLKEFKGPKYQRGSVSVSAQGTVIMSAPLNSVVLTAGSVTYESLGETQYAGWRFGTDGGLDEIGPASTNYTAKQAGQWWSNEPDSGIGSSYEVRRTSTTGTWNDVDAAGENTWVTISSDRIWRVKALNSPQETKTASSTFEVGEDGVESALDSAALTATASSETG